jgi:hypothetical protein
MSNQLGELSEREVQLVLRHRAARARQNRPMKWYEKILLSTIAVLGLIILIIMSTILYQLKQYMDNGEQGEISAPMSWVLTPKPKSELNPADTKAPLVCPEPVAQAQPR